MWVAWPGLRTALLAGGEGARTHPHTLGMQGCAAHSHAPPKAHG